MNVLEVAAAARGRAASVPKNNPVPVKMASRRETAESCVVIVDLLTTLVDGTKAAAMGRARTAIVSFIFIQYFSLLKLRSAMGYVMFLYYRSNFLCDPITITTKPIINQSHAPNDCFQR
mmetsp:Transcript_6403/g.11395  ORF Transcript_6403/g.11395 Transcript_6403/m.11395 type:complete len:119 (-) Transcript_6403:49-405(-)